MELLVKREGTSELGTPGRMFVNGGFECYTLEPPVGLTDSRGFTAIPEGRYKVELNYSKRFRQLMPQIVNVPGRTAIRIHWGDYESCTDGCILVGQERDDREEIWNTRAAFVHLFEQLLRAQVTGAAIWLAILPAAPAEVEG